ncbi:hypothetical protein [Streptomyces sp. NBC_00829]|nr:hypothetical protein OG293_32165 [Streptomyces sp. NBC_00829]
MELSFCMEYERGGGCCSESRTARARAPGEVGIGPFVEKEF